MALHLRKLTGTIKVREGYQLGYEITNDKKHLPVIVLVNGSLFNYHQWDNTINKGFRFAAKNCFRIVRYDYGGTGCSRHDQLQWDVFALAAELKLLLDRLEIERVSLYGVSKGTIVQQFFAAMYPERVETLAGYGWFHLGYSRMDAVARHFGERLKHFEDLNEMPCTALTPTQFQELWERVYAYVIPSQRSKLPGWFGRFMQQVIKRKVYNLLSPTPIKIMYDWFNYAVQIMPRAPQYFEQYHARLRVIPTLIQHARNDGTLPYQMAEELHQRLPNSTLIGYGAGYNHVSLTTNPLKAYQVIKDYYQWWLKQQRS